ncbi:MAG: phage major capsid protein, partial [Agathobaculum butyriciproducens]
LLQDDVTGEFPYRLLGKPVYLSDNMPKLAAGASAVLYGDYSGLSVNLREDISIQVLREKYATQHAIGVVAWFEFDSKVTDSQKLAVLNMKSA